MKKTSKWLFFIGVVLTVIAVINRFIYTLAITGDRLRHPKAHYYEWKFGKVFYTTQGDGPAVLLIHSTDSDASATEYNRIVGTLAKHYKVYTLDLLGYGRSDKPKMTYTAYMFVQLINDFAGEVIGEKVSLITSGKSNAFAAMACYQDCDRYKNLIFINPVSLNALKQNPGQREKMLKFLIELPIVGDTIYNLLYSRPMIRALYTKRLYNKGQIRSQFIEASYEAAHTYGGASRFIYASERGRFNNVNITDAIAGINNNIFIIKGLKCEDNNCSCEDYKAVNPAIECTTIDRTRQMPHLEKPESVLEILSVYLH